MLFYYEIFYYFKFYGGIAYINNIYKDFLFLNYFNIIYKFDLFQLMEFFFQLDCFLCDIILKFVEIFVVYERVMIFLVQVVCFVVFG